MSPFKKRQIPESAIRKTGTAKTFICQHFNSFPKSSQDLRNGYILYVYVTSGNYSGRSFLHHISNRLLPHCGFLHGHSEDKVHPMGEDKISIWQFVAKEGGPTAKVTAHSVKAYKVCHPNIEALRGSFDGRWDTMDVNFINKCYHSFWRRLTAVIEAEVC
ncbi:unnamed protein product [Lepeophtheirus salmonis]|uniref:(salmon louse) hypothetical protein n=1 Tax=Lepeophtheirus salmonis TaxID=72036 RepID=A0A7R8GYT8_LEPSM|nr:unnamed protein product [Lepeophtheirus salmonis]CAF2752207.1 unnamed protein product [Lepeophtheirus salmonis]